MIDLELELLKKKESYLKELLERSKYEVLCKFEGVSRYGLSRFLSFHVVLENLERKDITGLVASVLDLTIDNPNKGIVITGHMEDSAKWVVSNLSDLLYKDCNKLKSRWMPSLYLF